MEQLRAAGADGPQARKLLDSLFRKVHNLKASASANGLTTLANAAHEFENVLHSVRQHAVQQSIAEGARLFLLQASFDVAGFDREFQSLKETLNQNGEVISTAPSASKEHPGKVNFKILYAATHPPPDTPAVTVEEVAVTPTDANSFAQQLPLLERAFEKFATELVTIPEGDVLAQALRAGEAAAQSGNKHVDFEVRGDTALLDQLPSLGAPLLHLVRNAVDHGIEARGKVIIDIAKHDDHIAITVTDNGRGIDSSILEQIFQPGFSTAAEISNLSGRGVGLDAVKSSIEDLGGTVRVHSVLGRGTTFELTVPIRSA